MKDKIVVSAQDNNRVLTIEILDAEQWMNNGLTQEEVEIILSHVADDLLMNYFSEVADHYIEELKDKKENQG
ncbi:hypothetical protein [Anaerolinea sp.]|uniref:hypothetical protein n=1 Tax=Anaerolinea sp. TaxID=1872519 RepID=UPI002ACDF75C|nr:hypothetical protein [Anaerolinea sp.]